MVLTVVTKKVEMVEMGVLVEWLEIVVFYDARAYELFHFDGIGRKQPRQNSTQYFRIMWKA